MKKDYCITTIEALLDITQPSPKQDKSLAARLCDHIDEIAHAFIQSSPMVMLGTANAIGHVDVSPKGDAPGFVFVEDNYTLLFPERRGNTEARGLKNILENDQVSLLFLIPTVKEILRVTGRAVISIEPALLEKLKSMGKPAQFCLVIHVEESFLHCKRAFNRSHMWVPEKWPNVERRFLHEQSAKPGQILEGNSLKEIAEIETKAFREAGEADGAY